MMSCHVLDMPTVQDHGLESTTIFHIHTLTTRITQYTSVNKKVFPFTHLQCIARHRINVVDSIL